MCYKNLKTFYHIKHTKSSQNYKFFQILGENPVKSTTFNVKSDEITEISSTLDLENLEKQEIITTFEKNVLEKIWERFYPKLEEIARRNKTNFINLLERGHLILATGKTDKIKALNLYVGIDTEYVRVGERNLILSYQVWLYNLGFGFIFIPKKGDRLTFEECNYLIYAISVLFLDNISKITWTAHYSSAEILSFRNRKKTLSKINFKEIQKGVVGSGLISLKTKYRKYIKFNLYDTKLLYKVSLEKVAGEKIYEVEDKEHMDEFLKRDLTGFLEYEINNAYICVKAYIKFLNLLKEEGIEKPERVITQSQLTVEMFKKELEENQIDYKTFLGYEKVNIIKNGKTKSITILPKEIEDCKDFYHGGRNETFYYGVDRRNWFNYEFKDTYPTALLTLYDINWNKKRPITKETIKIYNDPFIVGFLQVDFKFKDNVKYPMFPVKAGDDTLIFPLEGEAWITYPEFFAAYKGDLLEKYTIKNGFYYPKDKRNQYVIPTFISKLIRKRSLYEKGSVKNKFYKNIVNNLYGKFVQGVNDKTSLNIKKTLQDGEEVREKIHESSIYNPAIASYITGVVRAVAGEYLSIITKFERDIISITTDGFITTQPLSDEDLKGVGVLGKALSEKRNEFIGDPYILELKHKSGKAINVAIKTRCYFMYTKVNENNMNNILIAKGGLQTNFKEENPVLNKQKVLDYLMKVYLENNEDFTYNKKSLTSLQNYVKGEIKDLITIETTAKHSVDFDYKRLPIKLKEEAIEWKGKTYKKITFDTRPVRNLAQFNHFKKGLKEFKGDHSNALGNFEKFKQYYDYLEVRTIIDDPRIKIKTIENVLKTKMVYALLLRKLLGKSLYIKKRKYKPEWLSKKFKMTKRRIRKIMKSKLLKDFKNRKKSIKTLTIKQYEKHKETFENLIKDLPLSDREYLREFLIDKT